MSEILCIRCSQHCRTCCQDSEVYVSPADEVRVAAHTGRNDFTEFAEPIDPIYTLLDDDPMWHACVFRDDGARRILRRHENGNCTFLGNAGCTLPLDVRPLVCRLYPFDYDARGIREQLANGCPTHLLEPGETLLVSLDMNRVAADAWHEQLYQEIQQEPHARVTPPPCTSA